MYLSCRVSRWLTASTAALVVWGAASATSGQGAPNYVAATLVRLNNRAWSWFLDPRVIVHDGKLIAVEGVLRNTPEAVEFLGEYRYAPRLVAGLAITCHGKPTAAKGERVRITGVDGNCLNVEAVRTLPPA